MMNYFSNRKKWMAYLILLTFVFTCIVPTNIVGGNNNAWAASSIATISADDIPGVAVNVFNYGADANKNNIPDVNETALANAGYVFFHGNYGPYKNLDTLTKDEAKYKDTRGSVDGMGASLPKEDHPNRNTYNRPTMNPELINGYPAETEYGYSLSYLFDNTYRKGSMTNGGGLFQLDETTGYYYYNSAKNAAYYNASNNRFDLYNVTVVPHYNDKDGSGHGGNFLPFNQLTTATTEPRQTVEAGEATHKLKATSPTDNWYGMTVEFKFMMPENGEWNGDDMVFNFSGDDDVWVYIDGNLVMDMGGTHGAHTGSINFADGTSVYQHNSESGVTTTTKTFEEIFGSENVADGTLKDYTEHTFKFFYMERGGNISNCSISFNMPISETARTAVKVWDDADNQDGVRPESVEVLLTGDNGYTTTSALSLENNWTVTWDKLPKYHGLESDTPEKKVKNGTEIVYTVTELDENGNPISTLDGKYNDAYTARYSTTDTVTTIINSHKSVHVTKTWRDGDNADGTRPASITINLFADGVPIDEAVVTAKDGWAYTFTNLPKYANGEEINYTISENEVNGYDTTYDGYNIINTSKKQVEVSGKKIWKVPADVELPVEEITIDLFRDDVKVDSTTASALNGWTYAFTDLDKYNPEDGKAYVYTVKEATEIDHFISEVVAVNAYQFNIINTYDRNGRTEVTVEKVWEDFDTNVTTHSAITIELYQNGILYDTAILGADGTWTMTFANLPKYDVNQKPFVYTVDEAPVNGYTTSVNKVKDQNKFIITNTLILGEPGVIVVEKQTTGDKKPANDVKFKFELQIEVIHPEGSNALFNELALLSEMSLGEAASALNDAIDEVENTTELVTSGSQYAFYLTEKENKFDHKRNTLMAVKHDLDPDATTKSAIVFEDGEGPVVTPEDATTGSAYEWLSDMTDEIVDEILKLSDEYDADEIAELLYALAEEIGLDEEEYSLALDNEAVRNLITAARVYNKLAGEQPDGLETTTPSALQVFQTFKGATTQSALYLVSSDDASDIYKVDFWLANGENIMFEIEATSGSSISYRIVESLSDARVAADYVGTKIFENGTLATTGTAYGFVAYEEDGQMSYLFQNNYKDNPYTPPYVPPKDPEIELEEPDVPLGEPEIPEEPVIEEPGIEIEEPEIPLGDAPRTGDATNAAPFMALMMSAMAGLVITRRRFN